MQRLSRVFVSVLVSVIVFLLTSLSLHVDAQDNQPEVCPDYVGVVSHLGWHSLYPPDKMTQAFDMIREAGIGWVRLNWAWKDMQPEAGDFDYSHYDMIAQMASERGIQILPILAAVPAWASTAPPELIAERGNLSPVDRYRAADMNDWLTYVGNVVERYDGDGIDDAPNSPRLASWEIWNEPNIAAFWLPTPDPAEYTELLIATYNTIKAADSSATIVLGGLAGSGVNEHGEGFLPSIYTEGAAPYFDVVSVHAYAYPTLDNIDLLKTVIANTRAVMTLNGDSEKPIWLTEVGWSDAPNAWGHPTTPPEQIAFFLEVVYTSDLGVEKVFWYNFRNIFDGSDDTEHNFGMVRNNFVPKPAYLTLQRLTSKCP